VQRGLTTSTTASLVAAFTAPRSRRRGPVHLFELPSSSARSAQIFRRNVHSRQQARLSARTYQVVDIELEGITAAGAAPGRFPGIELREKKFPIPFPTDAEPEVLPFDVETTVRA